MGERVPKRQPAPHRDVAHRPETVPDFVHSEDEDLDGIDRESADSFPASDPPSSSSPLA